MDQLTAYTAFYMGIGFLGGMAYYAIVQALFRSKKGGRK